MKTLTCLEINATPQQIDRFAHRCIHFSQLNFKQIFLLSEEQQKNALQKFLNNVIQKLPKKAKYSIQTGKLTRLTGDEILTHKMLYGLDEARVLSRTNNSLLVYCFGGELSPLALFSISKAVAPEENGCKLIVYSVYPDTGTASRQIVQAQQQHSWETRKEIFTEVDREFLETFNRIKQMLNSAEILLNIAWRRHLGLSTPKKEQKKINQPIRLRSIREIIQAIKKQNSTKEENYDEQTTVNL